MTRGTTAPNRLRRADRWITANLGGLLRSAAQPPLVADLGFGASPVTTVELFDRLRQVRSDVRVVGLEIDPSRVEEGAAFLEGCRYPEEYQGLEFVLGGFELPLPAPPLLVRAFNVLRQYDEVEAWQAWDRLCCGLAPDGVLVEGTCDEIGRRAVWVTLRRSTSADAVGAGGSGGLGGLGGHRGSGGRAGHERRYAGCAEPLTITFAAHLLTLGRPSELAERLPKTLIHRNIPGESIHRFFVDFDRSWAIASPRSVFGPRQRWVAAVEHLAESWPVMLRPPAGGRSRWRLGEVTLPWSAVAPQGADGRGAVSG